jgi:Ca2+-binding EF-hand superfamily protein
MSKTSNTAVIRERFGYHDENGDGVLSRNELYHVIRPN